MQKNAAPAVAALVKCLGDEEKEVALQSAWVLAEIGKTAADAIPMLETWLTSEDQRMRAVGACAIARISKSASVLPVLIDALENGDEYSRCYGALGCMPLGPLAAPATQALAKVISDGMRDPNVESRHHAIMALEDIGPGAAPAAGVLAKFLDALNGNMDVLLLSDGSAACSSLAAMGPGAREAIPALKNCLNWGPEDNEWLRLTRLEASEAIWRITGNASLALAVATEMLDDEFTQYDAVDLLGKLGADLQRLLEHDDEFVVRKARRALAKIMAGE
jgi:HEAT repeat protein